MATVLAAEGCRWRNQPPEHVLRRIRAKRAIARRAVEVLRLAADLPQLKRCVAGLKDAATRAITRASASDGGWLGIALAESRCERDGLFGWEDDEWRERRILLAEETLSLLRKARNLAQS